MKTFILVVLAACLALSMAHPFWGYGGGYGRYRRYGDENNDGVLDAMDHNRDGKVDRYFGLYNNGYYGNGYGRPYGHYYW